MIANQETRPNSLGSSYKYNGNKNIAPITKQMQTNNSKNQGPIKIQNPKQPVSGKYSSSNAPIKQIAYLETIYLIMEISRKLGE
jgi:hypothetical protein